MIGATKSKQQKRAAFQPLYNAEEEGSSKNPNRQDEHFPNVSKALNRGAAPQEGANLSVHVKRKNRQTLASQVTLDFVEDWSGKKAGSMQDLEFQLRQERREVFHQHWFEPYQNNQRVRFAVPLKPQEERIN